MESLEQQHAAEQRARRRLEQVPRPVAEQVAAAAYLDRGAIDRKRGRGQRGQVDQAGRQVRTEVRPRLELALVAVLDVLDDVLRSQEDGFREGVGDDLGSEVEVRVAGGDDHGRESLARVEHLGDDPVAVRAREGRVDHQRLGLSGDQHAGLVQRRVRRVDDGVRKV